MGQRPFISIPHPRPEKLSPFAPSSMGGGSKPSGGGSSGAGPMGTPNSPKPKSNQGKHKGWASAPPKGGTPGATGQGKKKP